MDETTECLSIIYSDTYEDLGSIVLLSGGVNLASFSSIPIVAPSIAKEGNDLGIDFYESVKDIVVKDNVIDFLTFSEKKVQLQLDEDKMKSITKINESNIRSNSYIVNSNKNIDYQKKFSVKENQLSIGLSLLDVIQGTFSIKEENNIYKIEYDSRALDQAIDIKKSIKPFDEFNSIKQNRNVNDIFKIAGENSYIVELVGNDQFTMIMDGNRSPENENLSLSYGNKSKDSLIDMKKTTLFLKNDQLKNLQEGKNWFRKHLARHKLGFLSYLLDFKSFELCQYKPGKLSKHLWVALINKTRGSPYNSIYIEKDWLYVENTEQKVSEIDDLNYFKNFLKSTRHLRDVDENDLSFIHNQIENIQHDEIIFRYTSKGDLLRFSMSKEVLNKNNDLIKQVYSSKVEGIEGIISSKKFKKIEMSTNGVLKVPADQLSNINLEIIAKVMKQVKKDPALSKSLQKLNQITSKDINMLSQLNSDMRESYTDFSLKDTSDNCILIDFRFSKESPQLLVKTKKDGIRIVKLNSDSKLISEESFNQIKDFKELKSVTFPVYTILKKLVEDNPGSNIFLTKEQFRISLSSIWDIHSKSEDISNDIHFINGLSSNDTKLQPPLVKEISDTTFLSTVLLKETKDNDVNAETGAITGISIIAGITWKKFQEQLLGSTGKQNIFMIRTINNYLVFSDKTISYKKVKKFLKIIPKNNLIYLISNGDNNLLELFADSNKFQRVILSRFENCNKKSFILAIQNVQLFIDALNNKETQTIDKIIEKIRKVRINEIKNKNIEQILDTIYSIPLLSIG